MHRVIKKGGVISNKMALVTIGVSLVLVLLLAGIMRVYDWYNTPSETTSSPPSSSSVGQVKNGREKMLYRFSPKECVWVEVYVGNVDFYPKGGEVEITPPPDSGIKPWRDKPGIQNAMSGIPIPPGDYKICGVDKDAWGIEVWN